MNKDKAFNRPVLSPKYTNQNFIANKLVSGFFGAAQDMLSRISNADSINKILEIGAGEGHISQFLVDAFREKDIVLSDIFQERLDLAKNRLEAFSNLTFKIEDICNLSFKDNSLDLIVCCEVLEHIPNFEKGLTEINRVLKKDGHLLLSVPREPIWRVLNIARGKYLSDFGNTPTHVNHWSSGGIKTLLEGHGFKVNEMAKPLPWTFLLSNKL